MTLFAGAAALSLLILATPASASAPSVCGGGGVQFVEAKPQLRLAYKVFGPAAGEPVVLIGGTGQSIDDWSPELLKSLVERGFRPVAIDVRDAGCSSHLDKSGPVDWAAFFGAFAKGEAPRLAYTVRDLANDVVTVMDEAGIRRAHVLGVSGGATVALHLASQSQDRVAGLVLLAANSGNPAFPMPASPGKLGSVPPPPPETAQRSAIIHYRLHSAEALEGSTMRRDRKEIEAWAGSSSLETYDPDAVARTGAALLAAGDLRGMLQKVRIPARVLHGSEDPLVSSAAGKDVAAALPQAKFTLVEGLGHSLPAQLHGRIITALVELRDAQSRGAATRAGS